MSTIYRRILSESSRRSEEIVLEVLLERGGSGYSDNYLRVSFPEDDVRRIEKPARARRLTDVVVDEAASMSRLSGCSSKAR